VEKHSVSLDRSNLVSRIWARDHTVWNPDPTEIDNRLGWLDLVPAMRARLDDLRRFADDVVAEGYTTVVLLGMGGSSLAPEVFRDTSPHGRLRLIVLDTTHPDAIAKVEGALDIERTLFIVASKSGSTIETRSHMAFFGARAKASSFIAITDPGTALEAHAREAGFREVFINPPDLGGRYSALSLFGLVPAALIGVDVAEVLDSAASMMEQCRDTDVSSNPGAALGLAMGEAALAARDKATLRMEPGLDAFGAWVEQLIAESSGKQDRGIVPVIDEPAMSRYAPDRFWIAYGDVGSPGEDIRLPSAARHDLGAEFFRWEFATAVACAVLGVNAFDQPNVEEAKRAASEELRSGGAGEAATNDVSSVLSQVRAGDYVALQAYIEPSEMNRRQLDRLRFAIGERHVVATTSGFGPRFLHSTGQLHKGGANNVVCIQVVDADRDLDLEIPDQPYTFGALLDAQAAGDLRALRARGRRVARTTLDLKV
jgi:transaldolase / glucose-6-phosphate isomerase